MRNANISERRVNAIISKHYAIDKHTTQAIDAVSCSTVVNYARSRRNAPGASDWLAYAQTVNGDGCAKVPNVLITSFNNSGYGQKKPAYTLEQGF